MVNELKALFISQVRIMKYEHLEKFLSIEIEESTCLESHLAIMNGIHGRLTVVLDYWMIEYFAIDGVLPSLPPVYKDVFLGYVMQGESFTFHEFLDELRPLKVEPIEGEVI
mgnify:CR=1 FL=1